MARAQGVHAVTSREPGATGAMGGGRQLEHDPDRTAR
jgi:hypothetical protein